MRETVIHTKNSTYQHFEVLKNNRNKRHRSQEFLVEGVRSLNEAVAGGWEIRSFLYGQNTDALSGWAKQMIATVPTRMNYRLADPLLAALSGKTDTSELLAVIAMRQDDLAGLPLSDPPFLVLFDRPSNRGNLGTLIRSCDALGADALLLTGHGVDVYDPEVVVSAMGSFFRQKVVRVADNEALFAWLADLKRRWPGFALLGTTAHRQTPIDSVDLTRPLLLMLGNETMGLNQNFQQRCDVLCTIPMAQDAYASSLNISCAASILLYEVGRQRRQAARP